MKETPILFSTPMVEAIIAGRKTQTRRIIKNIPEGDDEEKIHLELLTRKCPYGYSGDVLWVREKWYDNRKGITGPLFYYYANGDHGFNYPEYEKWKPSIHMPKEACRIFLQVEMGTVQRLHDITEDDAIAEGIERVGDPTKGGFKNYFRKDGENPYMSAKNSYYSLWCAINGIDSLAENPWVWVLSFSVLSTTGKPIQLSSKNILQQNN